MRKNEGLFIMKNGKLKVLFFVTCVLSAIKLERPRRRIFLRIIAAGVLCLSFCFLPKAYAYNKKLDLAVKLMLEKKYYEALDECYRNERFVSGYDKSELYFVQGQCLMSLDNYSDAREVFKKAASKAKGQLWIKVYMGIADSFFMEKRYDDAISVYEQLLEKNDSDFRAALLYKIGKSFQRKGKWAKSDFYFDKLKKEYPESFEWSLVERSSVGGNFFTIQVGCFSNKENAQRLSDDLRAKGYDVYITPFQTKTAKLYRVRVGEFVSQLAAEYEENKLKKEEHLPTHIFP
jgi:tetratricopeptide (TPR) repeat protein